MMTKYTTLNSYFNTTPKLWFKILIIFYGVITILGVVGSILDFSLGGILGSILYGGVILAIAYVLYAMQDSYVYARVGRHLKKYYSLEGDALVNTFKAMDAEAAKPLYKDASEKNKYFSFMITENWLIGSDGVMFLRMNACKRSDVISVDKKTMSNSKQTFYILEVKDKNNYTYQFALRSPENVELAYQFLKGVQEAV